MSMLQAQCDKLRAMAESVGLTMPQAATLMMNAADTIWELRGSVHRERAEADRLRTQLSDVTVSMSRVEERCDKLRELVKDMWHLMDGSGVTTGAWGRCVQILDRMRDLGIEA